MKNKNFSKLRALTIVFSFSAPLLVIGISITLAYGFAEAFDVMGFDFFTSSDWDPVEDRYGVLVFLAGTFLTTLVAVPLSLPFSLAIALLVSEIIPESTYAKIISRMTEGIAAIPSVIIGLWGIHTIVPLVQLVQNQLGYPPIGVGFFSTCLVLAFMIIPFSAVLMREVIRLVPKELKEAAYALGATRYETVRYVILPNIRSGLVAGTLLSTGRSIGETMAVTMLIGNVNYFVENIFSPTNTMSSIIANEFAEAVNPVYYSALMGIGLTLVISTFFVSIFSRWLLRRLSIN